MLKHMHLLFVANPFDMTLVLDNEVDLVFDANRFMILAK